MKQFIAGLLYWPMRGVTRVLYGKQKDYGGVRVGFKPCWREAYNQEQARLLHCRKPKNHTGDCAFW